MTSEAAGWRPGIRLVYLTGWVACICGLAFALYLEHFRGFEPCPMCVFQRVAMALCGIVFLVGALHGPRGTLGRWCYGGLAALFSVGGAGIAARHVWLQNLPPDQVPACGPTLDFLVDMLPLSEVVATVLRGDGNCAIIDAAWLGLSLPAWTLVAFAGLVVFSLAGTRWARQETA